MAAPMLGSPFPFMAQTQPMSSQSMSGYALPSNYTPKSTSFVKPSPLGQQSFQQPPLHHRTQSLGALPNPSFYQGHSASVDSSSLPNELQQLPFASEYTSLNMDFTSSSKPMEFGPIARRRISVACTYCRRR